MNTLGTAIIKTLAYFDVFQTPLTSEEVHSLLWKETAPFSQVKAGLDMLVEESKIEIKEGFFVLPGRTKIVDRRQMAIPLIDTKLKIASKAAKRIRWIPFFEAMFVCNTVASASASEDSDIDVFIVIRQGRLWITRLLITLTLSLYRMRRHKEHVANKICLSFYVTDAHLNLSDVTIDEPDIYMAYWIAQLIPIYDPKNIRAKILKENSWVKTYIPQGMGAYRMHPAFRVEDRGVGKKIRYMFETMWKSGYGDLIEKQAKQVQEKKMSINYASVKDEQDTRVVIDDTMLKFHENDRRAQYRDEWRKTVQHISTQQ
ncbi:MAG: hypothetical protein CO030_03040 [Candidatus Magasanikbacteria bacterium CG_4_9_14_0_2_um_filter_42_11]|uniref:Polymerase nucleotidyl transferase domain-containing protein n=1 Tax=Candidatus Magasanikbacteria bacterium CG_4_9_14_0_2_um_filter_42_11 TaxID=1974643 RepID=A0A2M8F9I8_9BACT|nr:MAG: hypothetical protein COU34_04940 [Candidatus Magasanikbacteria bacterium CG10_big_fil_rev_8_21_14_0_10_43_9]PIY92402.1 MAG: hypothetical protein COY70_03425 [Candidatus Magasanikbacteria bacterium CG_4_10_14_0_8_um_filter_42_12]PJC52400.1 MAG: hypothetical protein CO030_03040 [Candidatus Magasanikbacteria bacterium CG_4_9_14_0_2_um_filter_42_11]